MPSYNLIVSDSITTSERVDVLANGTRKIIVSDSGVTSENVDVLRAGARNITVLDSTPTSENVDIIRAGARNMVVLDTVTTLDNVTASVIQSPANIVRLLNLTLVVPATLTFVVTKKDV